MEPFEIEKYKEIALRWRWWIIIPFLLTLLGGLTYTLITPKIYEAKTLILVIPQKVPESYVRSIVHLSMESRLRTIKQQITSRTNLEKIIEEYQLFRNPSEEKMFLEEKVSLFRKRIAINVTRGTAFSISFRDRDKEKAMIVTNTLASNFIAENLKIRESQAFGTSTFLSDELDSVKTHLEEKEELLKNYQQKYMGAMPEQLGTNLSILGRLQNQSEQLNSNLRAAEERKLIIQQQIANAEMMQEKMADAGTVGSYAEKVMSMDFQYSDSTEIISLRKELALLENRYTANHPDVMRLKKRIAEIEREKAGSKGDEPNLETDSTEMEAGPGFSMTDMLKPQLEQIKLEIKNIKLEIKKSKLRVEMYQRRVEETPKRVQEMLSLNRDYENLKSLYNSLLKRKLEADISLNMEKKQKGEQFRVIDPAKTPNIPVKPNVKKIILLTLVVGLGLGGGLAYLRETMDTSFKKPEDIEEVLQIPIIASLPFTYNAKELRRLKRKKILTVASVGLTFLLLGVVMVLSIKGIDATINFVKDFFAKF